MTTAADTCAEWSAATAMSGPTATSERVAHAMTITAFDSPSPTSRRCVVRRTTCSRTGVATQEFEFAQAVGADVAPSRQSAHRRDANIARIRELIEWPRHRHATTGARASWPASSTRRARAAAACFASPTPIERSRLDAAESPQAGLSLGARGPSTAERHQVRSGCWAACASGCGSSTPPTRRSRASATSQGTALKSDARLRRRGDRAARHRLQALRHHHRHRRLHRQRRGLAQLLRPPDAQVPRHERRPRLRERDRRQGERAGGAAHASWRVRRGRASTSRSARTPTRTSGSRAATS